MTFEPDTLSFTASDYATAQTVIVTNAVPTNTDITTTLSTSSTDPAYNELTQVAFEDLFPFITYALHVHDAQTPEPEDSTRMMQVWFTLHPTDSGLPTAASDITIRYDVTGGTTTGDATAGTDYTAPSANTVTISPTDTSASGGESVVLADDSAIVTIGDPNENAIYFFPNYPLVDGDAAFFECYIVPPSGQSFTGSGVLISFDGFDSASSGATINGNSTLNGVDLSQYTGAVSVFLQRSNDRPSSRLSLVYEEACYHLLITTIFDPYRGLNDSSLLLKTSTGRHGTRLGFETETNYGYLASRDAPISTETNRFSCHGLGSDGTVSAAVIGGSFGTVEFGQSYE